MAYPNPPAKLVPFDSGPVADHDIGRQFDEHAKATSNVINYLRTIVRDDGVVRETSLPPPVNAKEATLPVGPNGPNQGGFYSGDEKGATATAADYAEVSIQWAEHMPDTIPPNILATNAITGDHWSSRWWANRAAQLVSIFSAGAGLIAEPVAVTAANALAPLSQIPLDGDSTMELIVNGRVFAGCASPKHFTVLGKQITWASTLYGVAPGDEVIARYRFSALPPTGTPLPAASLYYVATAGQTVFPMTTPDFYARSAVAPFGAVEVFRNGSRLMPDTGSGVGGYTLVGSTVTLLWPAGVGEIVTIDTWGQTLPSPPNWWLNLPTTLPPTSGVLWNNAGVICVS
jgi:hypothetical protein